ncbi:MAG: hypothetical protein Q9211_004956 [Gyalolechia sp. 1 TL-2023]
MAAPSPYMADLEHVTEEDLMAEIEGEDKVFRKDRQDRRRRPQDMSRALRVLEGLVVNKRLPKHNFTSRDLNRILLARWTQDDLIFIHERYRIQFAFIFRAYCWTGARLGAFFTGGLRYRDIDLVLQRVPGRWLEAHLQHQPEMGKEQPEHEKFIYNDAAFLLVMGALFGYETLDDLQKQQIPVGENELPLRFKESALNQPILRKCTKAKGVTDEPMPRFAFVAIFGAILRTAGYLCATSIHAIRHNLGKEVDDRYTEVKRSQHLTQGDPRVFGQSYVANTSSVDGQAAFLGERSDHTHIDYFQGLEKFRERGLPCQLPASLEHRVNQDLTRCKAHTRTYRFIT